MLMISLIFHSDTDNNINNSLFEFNYIQNVIHNNTAIGNVLTGLILMKLLVSFVYVV